MPTEPVASVREWRLASSVEDRAAGAVDVILRTAARSGCGRPPAATRTRCSRSSRGSRERSLYLRFHGIRAGRPRSSSSRSSTPTGPSAARSSGLAARRAAIVALANYVAAARPGTAEVGVRRRRRGAGPRHRHAAARAARRARRATRASTRFVAEVLAENRAMLGVFADAGFEIARELEQRRGRGALPDRARPRRFQARVEERDHVAVAASLRPFFAPRASP